MRFLTIFLLSALLGSPALAGLDPDTDSMGVYFDTAGNSNCLSGGLFQPLQAYLLLMNPAGPTDGFECLVTLTGAPHFVLSTQLAGGGVNWCQSPDCFDVSNSSLYPVVNGSVLLVTWTIMLQAPMRTEYYIRGTDPLDPLSLPVVWGNGVARRCGVSSGDVNLPVAALYAGGNCPVAEAVDSFGHVKSLYR